MKAFFPSPAVSVTVFLTWLLLNNTLDPAHLVLAAVLAVAVPRATAGLRTSGLRIRRWDLVAQLTAIVLWDIIKSNLEVARRILGPERAIHPRFVWVPLALTSPHGVLTLAGIITMTPGTISAELSPDRRHLLVHALHVDGGEAGAVELVAAIKARYEQPLLRIFEGEGQR